MERAGQAHDPRIDPAQLERVEQLVGLRQRRPQVRFAGDDQRRSVHIPDQRERRELPVALQVIPRESFVPCMEVAEPVVRRQRLADPVHHRLLRDRGAETIRLPDDPRGQDPARAAAGDEQVLLVDITPRDYRVHARHQVVVVLAGIVVVEEVAELLAVAGAAARVGVEDDIPGGRHQLHLRREAVAVVGDRAAVDLEDQRIPPAGIEVRRLDDPALDRPAVERGIPPDFLDFAEHFAGQQVVVERSDAAQFASRPSDRHFAGGIRSGPVEREGTVLRHRERTAAVRPAVLCAEVRRERLHPAVQRGETDLGVAFVVVLEVEDAAVSRPHRVRHAAVEVGGEHAPLAAVEPHHFQPGDLVGAHPVFEGNERDPFPVGRYRRAPIRAVAVGDLPDLAAPDRRRVDLRVAEVALPVRAAVRGEDQAAAVGCPRRGVRMVEVAGGDLHRRPAFRRNHEEVRVAEVEVSHAVLPVPEAVLQDRRVGPLRPRRRLRRVGDARRRIRDEHVEGDRAAVGRPADPPGRFGELRDGRGLAGVHPAHPDLSAGGERDPRPVRRPARRRAGAHAPVPAPVRVHQPQFRPLAVAHEVHRSADIDDAAAVRRDLRVRRELDLEDIHRRERRLRGTFLRRGRRAGRKRRHRQRGGEDDGRGPDERRRGGTVEAERVGMHRGLLDSVGNCGRSSYQSGAAPRMDGGGPPAAAPGRPPAGGPDFSARRRPARDASGRRPGPRR